MKSTQAQLKLRVSNMGNMSIKGFPKTLCKEIEEKIRLPREKSKDLVFMLPSVVQRP